MTKRTDIKLSIVFSKHMKKLLRVDRHEKSCFGVTLSQHYVIDALDRKKIMTMNELSQEAGQAISTLTRIVDILVRDKLVKRSPSATDRRKVCVELTKTGQTLASDLKQCTERFWTHVMQSIPDEKKRQIIESLQLLDEALDQTDGACCEKRKQEKEGVHG